MWDYLKKAEEPKLDCLKKAGKPHVGRLEKNQCGIVIHRLETYCRIAIKWL